MIDWRVFTILDIIIFTILIVLLIKNRSLWKEKPENKLAILFGLINFIIVQIIVIKSFYYVQGFENNPIYYSEHDMTFLLFFLDFPVSLIAVYLAVMVNNPILFKWVFFSTLGTLQYAVVGFLFGKILKKINR